MVVAGGVIGSVVFRVGGSVCSCVCVSSENTSVATIVDLEGIN